MPREKEPGMSIAEQKGSLRLQETEVKAAECAECVKERRASGDPTAYCAEHLRKIYGL